MTDAERDESWRRIEAEFGDGDEPRGRDLEGEVANLKREVGTLEGEIEDIRRRVGRLEERPTFSEGLSDWWGSFRILLWMVVASVVFAALVSKACT